MLVLAPEVSRATNTIAVAPEPGDGFAGALLDCRWPKPDGRHAELVDISKGLLTYRLYAY
jgi:hypothetical protein